MKFNEKLPLKDDLLKNPQLLANLIVENYCGGKSPVNKLPHNDQILLFSVLDILQKRKINYRQFNEILLLLNQDTVSKDFFRFFFEKDEITLDDLLFGVVKLRGYSLIGFGNFRYPYKMYRQSMWTELEKTFEKCIRKRTDIIKNYKNRPPKILDIEEIKKENTWFLGYIAFKLVEIEGAELKRQLELLNQGQSSFKENELNDFNSFISSLSMDIENTQKIGQINTEKYLTWDYIDVYIATSMRNSWEFEEVNEFIKNTFSNQVLRSLNIRYFDPTQSFCGNLKDKGLIEGLMLKRADCTIYLAQESDTMGKDSELASTLAQGKPVIAYVPNPDPLEYVKKIKDYQLQYFKKRFLILNAEVGFEDQELIEELNKFGENFEDIIDEFLSKYGEYRQSQPFTLFKSKDEEFKKGYRDFDKVCEILSITECYNFNKRAETLRYSHPLSMQVDISTGVANGVLVARSAEECALVLSKILTNDLEFDIITEFTDENPLGVQEGHTILRETISKSSYRVVTHQERLTNSFWNNFPRKT